MRFVASPIAGLWVIEPERHEDERGWFARTYDADEFAARSLDPPVQCNASFNRTRDTLRGLHYQVSPHAESKLVRCVRGSIYDVAVDLRRGSPTYCRWHAVELSQDNGSAFYIPAGLAHGFQTLSDDAEVLYQMGHHYVPEAARGVRWDDPAFAISWPEPRAARSISERDASYPDFEP